MKLVRLFTTYFSPEDLSGYSLPQDLSGITSLLNGVGKRQLGV